MCGIFGFLGVDGRLPPPSVQGLEDVLSHRGPDGSGRFVDATVYLGHRRLSIIDLHGGAQPMFNEQRNIAVIFNGEIYNFQDLRDNLQARGHRFATNSDTEVIVHAYEEYGYECLDHFRGMFAFALWDGRDKSLFLARDRLGIKPLFYADLKEGFCFASEMKALLKTGFCPLDIDLHALHSYFLLSYVPAPLTMYQQIRKLEPGHYLVVRGRKISKRKYWDLYFSPDHSRSEKRWRQDLLEQFDEAVRLRMISEVPLGAFLSGGIDSGTVVARMAVESPDPVHTFCMGFGGNTGGYQDERGLARQIAARYGTIHREHEVIPKVGSLVPQIIRGFDEPFADHSTIPSYYLCQMASREVTVALSGLGGDEMFGGYERYLGFRYSSLYRLLPSVLREKVVRRLVEGISERADGHYTVNHLKRFVRSASGTPADCYFGFLTHLDNRYRSLFSDQKAFAEGEEVCRDLVLQHFRAENADDPLDRVLYCDIKTYLPEDVLACTDRMSMLHSLEVRVPFIDHKLVEFCATIPNDMKVRLGQKKYLLRRMAKDLLPADIFRQRKQGFVGPLSSWLRTDLQDYVATALDRRRIERHGIFNSAAVARIIDDHRDRRETNDKLIWSLVMFQAWHEMYIEGAEGGISLEDPGNRRMVSVAP